MSLSATDTRDNELFTNKEMNLDEEGYDLDSGFHSTTGLNRDGIDSDGRNAKGFKIEADGISRNRDGLSPAGFDREGYHHKTGLHFLSNVTREGFNSEGWRVEADGVERNLRGEDRNGDIASLFNLIEDVDPAATKKTKAAAKRAAAKAERRLATLDAITAALNDAPHQGYPYTHLSQMWANTSTDDEQQLAQFRKAVNIAAKYIGAYMEPKAFAPLLIQATALPSRIAPVEKTVSGCTIDPLFGDEVMA